MADTGKDEFLAININGTPVMAIPDSGNSWVSAVSKDFYLKLGLELKDIEPMKTTRVGTANEEAHLKVLGKPKQSLFLQVKGLGPEHFPFRPIVVEKLAMDVNISKSFMADHSWDQLHSKNAISINGKEIPLTNHTWTADPNKSYAVHNQSKIIVPANSILAVLGVTEDKSGTVGNRLDGEEHIFGPDKPIVRLSSHPNHDGPPGKVRMAMYNYGPKPIELPKGKWLADIQPISEEITEVTDQLNLGVPKEPNGVGNKHLAQNKTQLGISDPIIPRSLGQPAHSLSIGQNDPKSLGQPAHYLYNKGEKSTLMDYDGQAQIMGGQKKPGESTQIKYHNKATCAINSIDPKPKNPKFSEIVVPRTKKEKKDLWLRQIIEKAEMEHPEETVRKAKIDATNWTPEQKRKWVIETFELKQGKILKSANDITKASDVLVDFFDLFSLDGTFGRTDMVEHSIITGDVYPVKCKYRPIHPGLEPDLQQQLDTWLEQGLIRPSNSAWSSNLVPARKANNKVRWCIDYRAVNNCTVADAFPMPNVTTNLMQLGGNTIFSTVDAIGAFHNIRIAEKDVSKTAFSSPFGLYEWLYLPFGLCNGPSSFCRLVEKILQKVPRSAAKSFLDDFLIVGPDLDKHIENLRLTLTEYRKSGLKLEPKKCAFYKGVIKYLGYSVCEDGIQPPKEFLEAVANWKLPRYKNESRAFQGFLNYYRSHCPKLSGLAASWTDVTGKTTKEDEKKPLTVTKKMEEDFEAMKLALTSAPILGFPYFNGPKSGPFTVDSDFSQLMIGAVLSQLQKEKTVVIAYGSKRLNTHQRNYSSCKGELYAIMYFLNNWRQYLQYGHKFIVRTDSAALKWLKSMERPPGGVIERWLMTISDFNFDLVHRAGKAHINADSLSRYGYATDIDPTDGAEHGATPFAQINAIDKPPAESNNRLNFNLLYPPDKMSQKQEEDEDLSRVRGWIRNNIKPDVNQVHALSKDGKTYGLLREHLSLTDKNVLQYEVPNDTVYPNRKLICLPKALWEEAIRTAHLSMAHMATEKTVAELRRALYFPGMTKEVASYVGSCLECQTKSQQCKQQRGESRSLVAGYPFQLIFIDLFGPFSEGKITGGRWLLTCKDSHSKWIEAIVLKRATAEEVAFAMERDIFARYSLPEAILSDMGGQFTGNIFKKVVKMFGIKLITTTGYHPSPNSVERAHRTMGSMLRALTAQTGKSWEEVLPQILYALRTAVHSSTGLPPFLLVFGRDISTPLDILFGNPNKPDNTKDSTSDAYVRALRQRVDRAQQYAREHLAKAVQRQRRLYHEEKRHFIPGAKVFLFTPASQPGQARKLTTFWSGPWVVSNVAENGTMVRIFQPTGTDPTKVPISKVVSIDRLKPYLDPYSKSEYSNTDDADQMEGDEFAEYVDLQPAAAVAAGPQQPPPQPPVAQVQLPAHVPPHLRQPVAEAAAAAAAAVQQQRNQAPDAAPQHRYPVRARVPRVIPGGVDPDVIVDLGLSGSSASDYEDAVSEPDEEYIAAFIRLHVEDINDPDYIRALAEC